MIYIVLFCFLLLGVFLPPKKQNWYLALSFIFLFLVSAFRDVSVGTDTESYKWLFDRVQEGYTLHRQEMGWYYLNKLIIALGGNFQWLLIISTLLVLIPIFIIGRKYSKNPMLSIFLFYAFYLYLQSFNITRQMIAVSLVFASTPLLMNKGYKYYLSGVLVSSLLHTTSLLCLPLIFANKISLNKFWWSVLIIISLVFGMLFANFMLPQIAGLFGYSGYLIGFEGESETGLFLILTNIFAIVLIFTSSKNSLYLQLYFIYILFYNIISTVPFAYRLVYLFSVIQLLFLPYYIYNNNLKFRKMALLMVIVYATVFFIRSFGFAGVVPYISTLF